MEAKHEVNNFIVDLQVCLDELNKNKVKNLSLSLHDIQLIEKAFTTLMMHLFDSAYCAQYGQVEIYKEDAEEIREGLESLRKFQRLFSMVNLNVSDTSEIGICFNQIDPCFPIREEV